MARHKLTNKDLEAMTATCSVDGDVKLHKAGTAVQCAVAAASRHHRWARLNPGKAHANRQTRSPHRLTSYDPSTLTGECPKCGTVGVVPKGRGFMCRVRAEELWTTQQSAPQVPCDVCRVLDGRTVYPDANGICGACEGAMSVRVGERVDPGGRSDFALHLLEGQPPEDEDYAHPYGPGIRLADEDLDDPYRMPDYESAVPRWKTLGSKQPWNEV